MTYQYLRVEDGPTSSAPALPARVTAPTPTKAEQKLDQALRDAAYYRGEMQRAAKERDEIKRSLESTDGAAAYWRKQAKDSSRKLSDALTRIDRTRKNEEEQRLRAIAFSEECDVMRKQLQTLKRGLWDIWTDVQDGTVKQALWNVWASL